MSKMNSSKEPKTSKNSKNVTPDLSTYGNQNPRHESNMTTGRSQSTKKLSKDIVARIRPLASAGNSIDKSVDYSANRNKSIESVVETKSGESKSSSPSQ